MLFAGTEFGAYFSQDSGQHWHKIAGLPTIAVREIAIQKRESDLVLGTFGRGIYIVDDYSRLRARPDATPAAARAASTKLYPVRDAVLFVPTLQYGMPGKGSQGEAFYEGDNPPYGALVSYQLADTIKTLKEKRMDAEKDAQKAGQPIRYPSADELRAEEDEEQPAILLTIRDAGGSAIRVLTGPVTRGLQRVAWDLRLPAHRLPPNRPRGETEELFGDPLVGPYVVPGRYSVTLSQRVGGVVTQLDGPASFAVVMDSQAAFEGDEQAARWQFDNKLQALRRDIAGALELAHTTNTSLDAIRKALDATPAATRVLHDQAREVQRRLTIILVALEGDRRLGSRSVPTPMAISERANTISGERTRTLARQTTTHEQQYAIAAELFAVERAKLKTLVETDLPAIETELERLGAPYTPGRPLRGRPGS